MDSPGLRGFLKSRRLIRLHSSDHKTQEDINPNENGTADGPNLV